MKDYPEILQYMIRDTEKYQDISMRIACLICNRPKEDFWVTDEMVENIASLDVSIPQEQFLIYKISDMVGEIFEDMDVPVESVEQLKALFILLDGKRIRTQHETQQRELAKHNNFA